MQAARMARAARRVAIATSVTAALLISGALPGADAGSFEGPIPPIGGSPSASPTPKPSPKRYEAADAKLLRLHNAERAERGRGTLKTDASLTSFARRRAYEMAAKQDVWHSRNLPAGKRWYMVGENVGRATTVEEVFDGFLASSSHRANVLRAGFTSVGIGVAERAGSQYVAVVYGQPWPASPAARARLVSGAALARPATPPAALRRVTARTAQGETQTVTVLVRLVALEQ